MLSSRVFKSGLAAFAVVLAVACLALVAEVPSIRLLPRFPPPAALDLSGESEKWELRLGAAGGELFWGALPGEGRCVVDCGRSDLCGPLMLVEWGCLASLWCFWRAVLLLTAAWPGFPAGAEWRRG